MRLQIPKNRQQLLRKVIFPQPLAMIRPLASETKGYIVPRAPVRASPVASSFCSVSSHLLQHFANLFGFAINFLDACRSVQ
jgi:hypothetical protein